MTGQKHKSIAGVLSLATDYRRLGCLRRIQQQ